MSIQKNLREIVLDTETTGLYCEEGDRIVDIACVELINHVPTGKTYQTYVNPQKAMHPDAVAISGITDDFLKDKPLFHEIADDFLEFVGDSRFVIHNAKFDIGFINSELSRIDKPLFDVESAIDTLEYARRKFPGSMVNLDALCKRFNIDNSGREKHGALIDCFLLAEVYIHLIGGRQSGLVFTAEKTQTTELSLVKRKQYARRNFPISEDDIKIHKEFINTINNAVWHKYY